MLHVSSNGKNIEGGSKPMIIEYQNKYEKIFESFKDFIWTSVSQRVELRSKIHELLLTNWCQIHDTTHLEFTCKMCHKEIKEAHQMLLQFENPEEVKEESDTESKKDHQKHESQEHIVEGAEANQMQNRYEKDTIDTHAQLSSQPLEQVWIPRFYGSHSKKEAGAGFELTNPNGEVYLATHKLHFPYMNNFAEYVSLIHGLLQDISQGARVLHAFGDSEIVVKQVRKKYIYLDKRLSHYHNRVWDLIESFDAFNIQSVNLSNNQVANSLAQATSSLEPLAIESINQFTVELSLIPSIPDNVTNFEVFEDDDHICEFLLSSDIFATQIIDEDETIEEAEFDDDGIMNLKINIIPRGIIKLERMFNQDQINEIKNQKTDGDQYEKVNAGVEDEIRNVCISKICTLEEKAGIILSLREFFDVIA